ncbi:unnamed protein product, partial [Iphiclides podalirius]
MPGTMKVLGVVLLAVAAVAIPGKRCPKIQEVDWEIEVLLPHGDCDKFYQCTLGEPVEMSCPKGLFYSILKRECEWPEFVECGDRVIPDASKPDGEKETETTPVPDGDESVQTVKPEFPVVEFLPNGCPVDPDVHWLLPHEKTCKRFYYCERGNRELRLCPRKLHFNRKRQVCDWPWNAGCNDLR